MSRQGGLPILKGGKLAGWFWRDLGRNLTRVTPCRGGLRSLLLGLFHFALSSVFVSHAKRLPQLANHSQRYPSQADRHLVLPPEVQEFKV
jgi:hypothetical protein